VLASVATAACGVAACKSSISFVLGGGIKAGAQRGGSYGPRSSIALGAYQEMSATAGLAGFQGSELSLWTTFFLALICIPGVASTIQRTGQAKFIEKSYVMPGTASGGLEMRSIAGGVVAYFKGLNYAMEDSPQKGKIRFVGNLQGSISQALYLTSCLLGTFISSGFLLQSVWPEGPFGLGVNLWYVPCILSPAAGAYYWSRAFRRDMCEMQLEMTEDCTETTLSVLGDKETIEALQKGVRFQSPEGKLFALMERGMEYQPGIFDDMSNVVMWNPSDKPAASSEGQAKKVPEVA